MFAGSCHCIRTLTTTYRDMKLKIKHVKGWQIAFCINNENFLHNIIKENVAYMEGLTWLTSRFFSSGFWGEKLDCDMSFINKFSNVFIIMTVVMANSHWVSLCTAHFPEHKPGNRLFFTSSLSSYYYQCQTHGFMEPRVASNSICSWVWPWILLPPSAKITCTHQYDWLALKYTPRPCSPCFISGDIASQKGLAYSPVRKQKLGRTWEPNWNNVMDMYLLQDWSCLWCMPHETKHLICHPPMARMYAFFLVHSVCSVALFFLTLVSSDIMVYLPSFPSAFCDWQVFYRECQSCFQFSLAKWICPKRWMSMWMLSIPRIFFTEMWMVVPFCCHLMRYLFLETICL